MKGLDNKQIRTGSVLPSRALNRFPVDAVLNRKLVQMCQGSPNKRL